MIAFEKQTKKNEMVNFIEGCSIFKTCPKYCVLYVIFVCQRKHILTKENFYLEIF